MFTKEKLIYFSNWDKVLKCYSDDRGITGITVVWPCERWWWFLCCLASICLSFNSLDTHFPILLIIPMARRRMEMAAWLTPNYWESIFSQWATSMFKRVYNWWSSTFPWRFKSSCSGLHIASFILNYILACFILFHNNNIILIV